MLAIENICKTLNSKSLEIPQNYRKLLSNYLNTKLMKK